MDFSSEWLISKVLKLQTDDMSLFDDLSVCFCDQFCLANLDVCEFRSSLRCLFVWPINEALLEVLIDSSLW